MLLHDLPNTLGLVLIVAVALLFRARRTIGRQLYSEGRAVFRLVLLGMLLLVVLTATPGTVLTWAAVVLGLAVGGAVGLWGLRLAHVEQEADRLYYRPNLYLSIAVLALFLVRIVWQTMNITHVPHAQTGSAALYAQYASDPTSLLLLSVYVGYWAAFYVSLMLRAQQMKDSRSQ